MTRVEYSLETPQKTKTTIGKTTVLSTYVSASSHLLCRPILTTSGLCPILCQHLLALSPPPIHKWSEHKI